MTDKLAELHCRLSHALGLSHQSRYRATGIPGRTAKGILCYSVLLTAAALSIPPKFTAAQNEPATIRADSTFDSAKWPLTVEMCSQINQIFRSKFAEELALGTLPIIIAKSSGPLPGVELHALPKAYKVMLTTPDTRQGARIAYQAGHEVAHIWIGPRGADNWFVESVCTAASHICLEEMAAIWKKDARRNISDYGPEFNNYDQTMVAGYLKKYSISSESAAASWVTNNGALIARQTSGAVRSQPSRDVQHVCSVVVRQKLRTHPKGWRAIVSLGACTRGSRVDFSKWRQLVADDDGLRVGR